VQETVPGKRSIEGKWRQLPGQIDNFTVMLAKFGARYAHHLTAGCCGALRYLPA
jgi:hypothetical protein